MVAGHAILKLIHGSDVAYEVYLFIYSFHLPVFVGVSGYFAKSSPPGMRQLHRILTDIVFPYLVFETIWTLIRWLLGGDFWLDYTSASWTLWFLIALAIWRITLPALVLLRYPLFISIIISVGAGYIQSIDRTFALSRTFGLSLRVVGRVFKPLVEPRARWLFRSHQATQTGTIVLPPVEPK